MTIKKKIEAKYVLIMLAITAGIWALNIYEITQNGVFRPKAVAIGIVLPAMLVVMIAYYRRGGGLAYTFDERGITYHKVPSSPVLVPWGRIQGLSRVNQAFDPVIADEAGFCASLPEAWKKHLAQSARTGIPPFRMFFADTDTTVEAALAYIEPRIHARG